MIRPFGSFYSGCSFGLRLDVSRCKWKCEVFSVLALCFFTFFKILGYTIKWMLFKKIKNEKPDDEFFRLFWCNYFMDMMSNSLSEIIKLMLFSLQPGLATKYVIYIHANEKNQFHFCWSTKFDRTYTPCAPEFVFKQILLDYYVLLFSCWIKRNNFNERNSFPTLNRAMLSWNGSTNWMRKKLRFQMKKKKKKIIFSLQFIWLPTIMVLLK